MIIEVGPLRYDPEVVAASLFQVSNGKVPKEALAKASDPDEIDDLFKKAGISAEVGLRVITNNSEIIDSSITVLMSLEP